MSESQPDPVDVVLGYHERTKHYVQRYARALGYMDWSTQPNPFRRFEGAPLLRLDEIPATELPTYDDLFDATLPSRPLDRSTISQFFYDALALSAWKEYGDNRWSLRVNPSSGNLHPTEAYLLAGAIPDLRETPGLYHYAPLEHGLELRRDLPAEAWLALGLPPGSFLVGLTSIYWRESWKYGERAFRYCQHDLGHAVAALAVSAAALGWRSRLVDVLAGEDLARLLGVSDQEGPEAEHPDTLVLVSTGAATLDWTALDGLCTGTRLGTPNALSAEHHDWPIIEVVGAATEHEASPPAAPTEALQHLPLSPRRESSPSGRAIVRQRRSAVSMDGLTSISRDEFFRMLERVMPAVNTKVFGALPWTPAVHLAIFVHRVRDLPRGLYLLVREAGALPQLRAALRPELSWVRVAGAPETVELYRLVETDVIGTARAVSCGQDIAADGAFALGMIAHFEPAIRRSGASFYRRLHWETGAIGQMLYLEAEAAGVRATGIGCFFDDAMHNVLGLQDATFQTLYHFTVGGPVEDPRLRTAPAYGPRR